MMANKGLAADTARLRPGLALVMVPVLILSLHQGCRDKEGPQLCGNGTIDPDEECDDGALNSDTDPDACRTDCRLHFCGDGVTDASELCDGADIGTHTCQSVSPGSDGGVLACGADCTFNVTGCVGCGNGVADPGEDCDATDLAGATCSSASGGTLPYGELVCSAGCVFDLAICHAEPSCAAAGGNLCIPASSTLCEGLAHLASHDCEVCCYRPAYPPPTPASLHFVYQSSLTYWDSILALAMTYPSVVLINQNMPQQVGPDRWSAYLSYRDDPQPTAQDINLLLVDPVNAPRFVMLEELHDAASEAFFVAIAEEMRMYYPQWEGRWGAFLSFGNYPLLSQGIDALLMANAVIALELYPRQSEYCAAGSNGGQRDIWLSEQFVGNANLGRLNWLVARRTMHNSQSFITPVFGVGDVLLDGQSPAVFLDRMFYVWMTRTGYPSMISAANGGPGAYKWQNVAETPLGYGVGNTSRDLAFSESFNHYSVMGLTSSRLGPVPCP